MKFLRCGLALVVAAVVLFPLPTAARSDMSGIHAIVERVVFEPATGTPTRIQVWGAFRIGKAAPGGGAGTPELGRGYLYFSVPPVPFSCTGCPPASAATQTALYEWNDLKAVAGTGEAVGFGHRTFAGKLRPATAAPADPDAYPLGIGLFKLGTVHPYLADLKKLLP